MSHRMQDEREKIRRVVLELILGVEPIGGRMRVNEDCAHPFAGYTQLIAELDAARRLPGDDPPAAGPDPTRDGEGAGTGC